MTRRAIIALVLACAVSAGASGAALAASGPTASQAITDCNTHGRLTTQYSSAVLRQALAQMPADVREDTDCYDVIQGQLLKQIGSTGSGSGTASTSRSSGGAFRPAGLIVVSFLRVLSAIPLG